MNEHKAKEHTIYSECKYNMYKRAQVLKSLKDILMGESTHQNRNIIPCSHQVGDF